MQKDGISPTITWSGCPGCHGSFIAKKRIIEIVYGRVNIYRL